MLIYCALVGLNNRLITNFYVDTFCMLTTLISFTSRQMACKDNHGNSVCQVTTYTSRGKAITMARQAFGKYTPVCICSRQTIRLNSYSASSLYNEKKKLAQLSNTPVVGTWQFPLFPSRVQVKLCTPRERMGVMEYISRH